MHPCKVCSRDLVPKTAMFGRQGENVEEEIIKASYK
jgi:hypothetical protein